MVDGLPPASSYLLCASNRLETVLQVISSFCLEFKKFGSQAVAEKNISLCLEFNERRHVGAITAGFASVVAEEEELR